MKRPQHIVDDHPMAWVPGDLTDAEYIVEVGEHGVAEVEKALEDWKRQCPSSIWEACHSRLTQNRA